MPQPGRLWYQVILDTRCTWLHGDPRGFHSKHARIQSTGDYKKPPPQDEHAGLRRYYQDRSGPPMRIPPHLLPVIGTKLVEKIQSQDHRLLAVSVDAVHVHLLAELPRDRQQLKLIVGTWKQAASHAVRREMPGRIWAEDCDPEPMRNEMHHRNTFAYILRHVERGAFVWRFDATG